MLVIAFATAWLLGILFGIWLTVPSEVGLAVIIVSSVLAVLWWRIRPVRVVAIACLVAFLGIARSQAMYGIAGADSVARYNDAGVISVRGVVAEDPVPRNQALELHLDTHEVRTTIDGPWQPAKGVILVRQGLQPEHRYGDLLEVQSALETPRNIGYQNQLARQGIYSVMSYPNVTTLGEDQDFRPLVTLHNIRRALAAVLERSLPEPQASLAAGILLGKRSDMPADLTASFARTNTTHIIAISGANVSLVAAIMLLVCRSIFGRRPALVAAILGIIAYALLVGTSPSVVRASLMGTLYVVGDHLGRLRDTTLGLALAAVAMTAADPPVLLDLGFQLSFLGTAGLVLIAPLIATKLSRLPDWLVSLLAPTLAAEATTMPLILMAFGQFSVVGPFANLLVPPLLPLVMASSGILAVTGLFSSVLGQLVAAPAWLFLFVMTFTVETLSTIPFAALSIGSPGATFAIVYYALLAALLLQISNPTTRLSTAWKRLASRLPTVPALGALTVSSVLVWSAVLTLPSETLRLSFLDVGQGDAILVRTPQHKVLIDGGPNLDAVATALGRRLPFWDRDVDLMILTHPNEDHLAGLIGVLERYKVHAVLDTGVAAPTATYARYRDLVRERAIDHWTAETGQVIDLDDGISLKVLLAGTKDDVGADLNDSSIVLALGSPAFTALLTGDIGPNARADLLASGLDLQTTVLKVPHHGSASGLDEEFLSATSPRFAVVSVGRGNRFGHPAPETISMLGRLNVHLFRTDLNGTTEFISTPDGYRVETQR